MSGQEKVSELPDDVFNDLLKKSMESSKDKLKLSKEEEQNFYKAMQQPEFTKLMKEYMDEISDPKNREEQEMYLRQLEAENKVPQDMKLVQPTAGFVIKTQRIENGAQSGKLFINVCSLDLVEKAKENKAEKGSRWDLPYSLGPIRHENDKSGVPQPTLDFALHPDTLAMCSLNGRFQQMVVDTAVDAVGARVKEMMSASITLDKSSARVLKNVSCIGNKPAIMHIPQKVKQQDAPQNMENRPAAEQKAKAAATAPASPATPAANEPKYTIIHRGHVELGDYANDVSGKPSSSVVSKRPKELVLRIQLPKISKASQLDIETSENGFKLRSTDAKVADYSLNLDLPYPVYDQEGRAKFDKEKRTLEVVLKVKQETIAIPAVVSNNRIEQKTVEETNEVPPTVVQFNKPEKQLDAHKRWLGEEKQQHEEKTTSSPELSQLLEAAKQAAKLPLPKAEEQEKGQQGQGGERGGENAAVPESGGDFAAEKDPLGFVAANSFGGWKPGYVFKSGPNGLGYYADKNGTQVECETRDESAEHIAEQPIVSKVSRMTLQSREIYQLD